MPATKEAQKRRQLAQNHPGYKQCTRCLKIKSVSEFSKIARNYDGLGSQCKECTRNGEKFFYKKSEKIRKNRYAKNRLRKFGITQEEFEKLLQSQNYCCAICKIHLDCSTKGQLPCMDHCHKTGMNRGILCGQCNMGLGQFQDNEGYLLGAIQYIRLYKS